MILSPQQQFVINALIPVTKIATNGCKSGQSFCALTNTMLLGPSGVGKSYIARALAKVMGLPALVINVATYVVISARSEPYSMTSICAWLAELESGGILILDELDKLGPDGSGGESCDWNRHVRLELHEILQGSIPISAKLPCPSHDPMSEGPPDETTVSIVRGVLEERLRNHVMIVGCGAWQRAWRANANRLGFSSNSVPIQDAPSNAQILESISCELRQRFRDEVLMLQPMRREDYHAVASEIEKTLKADIRSAWKLLLEDAIDRAIAGALGMRAFEELLLQAMIYSMRQHVKTTTQEKSAEFLE